MKIPDINWYYQRSGRLIIFPVMADDAISHYNKACAFCMRFTGGDNDNSSNLLF